MTDLQDPVKLDVWSLGCIGFFLVAATQVTFYLVTLYPTAHFETLHPTLQPYTLPCDPGLEIGARQQAVEPSPRLQNIRTCRVDACPSRCIPSFVFFV